MTTKEEAAKEYALEQYPVELIQCGQTDVKLDINYPRRNFAETEFIKGADWREQNPNWISVKDRLPEDRGNVLILWGGEVVMGWYHVEEDCFDLEGECARTELRLDEVDGWLPMPNAPRGRNDHAGAKI